VNAASPSFLYSLYGRAVDCDIELPFVPRASTPAAPDIELRLRTESVRDAPRDLTRWFESEATEDGSSLAIDRTGEGDLVMSFTDGTSFRVSSEGCSVALLTAPAQYTPGDLAAYALGPVLALALHQRGATLLHASAVVIGGHAVLFAGASGSGKSTVAAILHQQGYAVLSDDLTEVSGDPPAALPSVPAIRLWPDVVNALYGPGAAFPDRAPSWDKKMVAIAGTRMDSHAHPIAAVLFLERRGEGPRLERLGAKDSWMRLIAHSYTARLPDRSMAASILNMTTALANRVPASAFSAPSILNCAGLGAFLERELAGHLR